MTTMLTANWKYTAVLTALALTMAAPRAEAAPLVWGNNSGDLTWNTTSPNWGDGVTLYDNTTPDSVTFGPSNMANFQTINVAAGLTPASVTFNTGALGELSISGGWGGSGSFTKWGNGQLNVFGASTYTGGTFINQGRLSVRTQPVGVQNITVETGATLMSRSNHSYSGTLTLNGGKWHAEGNDSWTGPVILNNDSIIESRRNVSINGVMSGPGGITKLNNGGGGTGGNLTLNGVNTYTGDTLINRLGTITLPDDAGLLFDIGAAGVNNQIASLNTNGTAGPGFVNLHGDFTFDLTDAGKEMNDTWNIVDLASLNVTFGPTFSVNDFDEISDGEWARLVGGTTYTFSETSGLLVATPEPSTLAMLGLAGLGLLGLGLYRRRRLA